MMYRHYSQAQQLRASARVRTVAVVVLALFVVGNLGLIGFSWDARGNSRVHLMLMLLGLLACIALLSLRRLWRFIFAGVGKRPIETTSSP
jgi:hypothetical protein